MDYDLWELRGIPFVVEPQHFEYPIKNVVEERDVFQQAVGISNQKFFENTALLHDFPRAGFFVPDHVLLGLALWGLGSLAQEQLTERSLEEVRTRIASNGLEEAYVLDARYLIELADKHLEGGVEGMTPFHKEFIRLYLGSEAPACCRA